MLRGSLVALLVVGCSSRSLDHLSEGVDAGDASTGDGTIFPSEGCGTEGAPCCEGSSCPVGLACTAGTCQKSDAPAPCGAKGQPCCGTAATCFSPLVCVAGACTEGADTGPPPPCGASGQPCCAAPATACGEGLTCAGTTCTPCGDATQPCCAGSCRGKTACSSGGCVPCGAGGQLCCGGGACDVGTVCSGPSCIGCGGVGQPCCGSACGGTTGCISGVCKQCCALCKSRTAYHRVDVSAGCTEASTTFCSTRGGLSDAKWDYCAP